MADSAAPRLLVVGTAHGARIHLPAARAAGFDCVGLVGMRAERTTKIAERNGVPHAFTDLAEAIRITGAQAVAIAAPPAAHAALAITAAEAGCHIYCEKPLGIAVAEAESMHAAAKQARVVTAVGNQMRMLPARRALRAALHQGRIGTARMVTLVLNTALLSIPGFRMPEWFYHRASGGGWLNASGSHAVDMLRDLLGEFASVSAAFDPLAEGDADGGFSVQFTMRCGASGVFQQSGAAQGSNAIMTRITGNLGTLWLEEDRAFLATPEWTEELAPVGEPLAKIEPGDHPRDRFRHLELAPAIAAFAMWRASIDGQPGSPLATFADGLAAVRVLDAIRRSADTGQVVAL